MSEIAEGINLIYLKIAHWLKIGIAMLPNLVLALATVLLFHFLSKWSQRAARGTLDRFTQLGEIKHLLSVLVRVAVLCLGLFFALSLLDLDKTVTSLLAGIGIIGLALGFAFQDIAANFMSGVLLSVRRPFNMGDVIQTKDLSGTVSRIDLRVTELLLFTGEYVLIPNKEVLQNPIINYTKSGKRRIDLQCGVSYGDDLETVREVALKAINGLEIVIDKSKTSVLFDSFGDSSVNFTARFWVMSDTVTQDFLTGRDAAVRAIKKAFDEADIMIPFPIRTLDFGIKGGQKLSDIAKELPVPFYNKHMEDN